MSYYSESLGDSFSQVDEPQNKFSESEEESVPVSSSENLDKEEDEVTLKFNQS